MLNVVNDDGGAVRPIGADCREPMADTSGATPVDFAFLALQTFSDAALQREVLGLFVAQARRVVPKLPSLSNRACADAAHLLKGSARGIGAWDCAAVADAYEGADASGRILLFPALVVAFDEAEAAIGAHLAALA